MASFLRSLALGRVAYRFVFAPLGKWRDEEHRMRRRAARLPASRLPEALEEWPTGLFMTGEKFWHQTIFCARSFEAAVGRSMRWEFFDDGTLDTQTCRLLGRIFPRSRVISAAESRRRLETTLPPARFPALHAARAASPLMGKLLDLRAGRTGPSLYLDSDMLFFSAPSELVAWLGHPRGHLFMHDELESYALGRGELDNVAGVEVLAQVNSGLLAFDDTPVDWAWLETVAARAGRAAQHRLFEQTLTAIHLSVVPARRLPREQYRLLYEAFTEAPPAALLHYCWNAKPAYLSREWRRCLPLLTTA